MGFILRVIDRSHPRLLPIFIMLTKKLKILHYIALNPKSCCRDIANGMGYSYETVRTYVSDLGKEGKIQPAINRSWILDPSIDVASLNIPVPKPKPKQPWELVQDSLKKMASGY